jgi:SAM-dependent methyltransferase
MQPAASAAEPRASERRQRVHYDRILPAYEAHYDDPTSRSYRERFLYEPLFRGVDLSGKRVLEAMCGSGQATSYLLRRGARVVGLDLSAAAVDAFQHRWPDCPSVRASILASGLASESFDAVVLIGGLHHVHPHVDDALREVHRILVPGGRLLFGEPHAGSLPDALRRVWYRWDPTFEAGEQAVDLEALKRAHATHFAFELERYVGNLAYLLVLNSMAFRIPVRLKPVYAPALFVLERGLAFLNSPRTACFTLGRWRRRGE